jgi:iron complex transport system substrate-binding protein
VVRVVARRDGKPVLERSARIRVRVILVRRILVRRMLVRPMAIAGSLVRMNLLRMNARRPMLSPLVAAVLVAGLAGPGPGSAAGSSAAVATPAASPSPIVVRDDRGTEHRFSMPPQRIVTLLPSLTEAVAALGAGPRLVGVDRFSNWPDEVAGLPRLGGLDDALIEAIATLRPDVVLASISARSLDRLEALGLVVVRLRSESHADVLRSLRLVARLVGDPPAAEALWERLQDDVASAARRIPAWVHGRRVYFEIGGGPYGAGATSFIGETLARLGLDNVIAPELGPFPKLNPEFVIRARPDVIIGVQREVERMPLRPGWHSIPAIRDGRLCALPTRRYELVTRPGPRLGEAAAALADCLQGLPQP